MDKIRIRGGRPLSGEIGIGGAKNAALPLMAAGLLTDERLVLTQVPLLDDISTMGSLLAQHGIAVEQLSNDGRRLSLGGAITCNEAPYDIVRKMRASVLVLGPLVARVGEARVSLPGGCAIGTRPVDLHLQRAGADGRHDPARCRLYPCRSAAGGLRGAAIVMPFPSVGATENLLMAASLADGQTVLANAAREPEISRPRRLPGGDGRAHRRHRHRPAYHRGRDAPARRRRTPSSRTASRPAPMPAPRRSPAAHCICAARGWTILARLCGSWAKAGSR